MAATREVVPDTEPDRIPLEWGIMVDTLLEGHSHYLRVLGRSDEELVRRAMEAATKGIKDPE